MRKSCTQHEKVYLGGQYYVVGHPNLHLPFGQGNETFENLKVTGLLGMISGMLKLSKFQS